jgi:hypothetical protein
LSLVSSDAGESASPLIATASPSLKSMLISVTRSGAAIGLIVRW